MPTNWVPLESNPEVMNSWAEKAGLVTKLTQFSDVYGLDNELLGMVPQPVKAVLLLFPISDQLEAKRREEDEKIRTHGPPKVDPTVMWIKQTISNACGTIGLLHAITNSDVTIVPESPLAKFIDEAREKTPAERAELLEKTSLFADIHSEAAQSGQSAVPTNLDTNLHFTCFVKAPAVRVDDASPAGNAGSTEGVAPSGFRVLELDGRREGIVDRGECKDLLHDVAQIVKDNYMAAAASMEFSMMAFGPPPDW
ncbi:peptidase C12, ubiquitin carboxyl-terminal hydrolase 1 [Schizophyllum commune H4-8]|uniref:Ubiquitin carboxyl-terminal hydrolase n=1 Tax=Schizophyllum commune (strain H4-8 / FGSC 9210) TaxID=578458 RepID=D8Q3I0_SCHCM|nr:peptidase C12, ubiquitin carboxyl-terminal hydrolase 1 [Schizophyllum commune H4-8]KAI5894897.1 peptidase C12, ubiquitin carboxyl-terminal hydrolase 1 [Schizophyllum commune H4-8]